MGTKRKVILVLVFVFFLGTLLIQGGSLMKWGVESVYALNDGDKGKDKDKDKHKPMPVPEPSTLILLGVGLAGVGGWYALKSRKKNKDT